MWPTEPFNLLHFTTGEDCCGKGSRIPYVSILSDNNNQPILHVAIAITGNQKLKNKTLELKKDYSVLLTQDNGEFSLTVDGIEDWKIPSGKSTFAHVQLWQSNRWEKSAGEVAEMKNLLITNGKAVLINLICFVVP